MNDGRIISQNSRVVPIIIGVDEAITRDSLTLSTDIVLTKPALVKVKSSVTTGNIKMTLAGDKATAITMSYADINEANLHVVKIFKTGTTCAITDFYLWQ